MFKVTGVVIGTLDTGGTIVAFVFILGIITIFNHNIMVYNHT